ncbi:putative NRPS-like protein biosynthetic cluster [Lithohypha guttulata]|uniref:putative NRPS-like protein biosynthetic cluster n=1 Tax=Lithohypha guttulata TaxID=1690604 RepID=UPI00315D2F82
MAAIIPEDHILPAYDDLRLSITHGPADKPLLDFKLADFLDFQCHEFGLQECLVIPWTGARWTYDFLKQESVMLAKAMAAHGIRPGDRVGIMAGNCEQYVAVFFACMRVGAILVILNNTYTMSEDTYALEFTECRMFFTTPTIGRHDNHRLLSALAQKGRTEDVVILRGFSGDFVPYISLIEKGASMDDLLLNDLNTRFSNHDVCNLQFTSGTTGHPKAAMLTHHSILNNSRFIGDRLNLTDEDVLCCPPPLFHCFGLVLGLLATITHGGIIAGAPVPRHLMELLVHEFGMIEFTSSYGLTEASPTCFNAYHTDGIRKKLTTVGSPMPYLHAKIVDRFGRVVLIETRGELCIAGYQLQKGYWNNQSKTDEVMIRDENGVLWLHTGDEAVMHEDGSVTITGRFKDIIIRGGENIYPLEIEERLVQHPDIERAIVVGVNHNRYGEVVACFLLRSPMSIQIDSTTPASAVSEAIERGEPEAATQSILKASSLSSPRQNSLDDEQVRDWVRQTLGRHKAPAYVFWLGEGNVPADVPLTGSGKVKKYEMKKLAEKVIARREGAKM